MSEPKLISPLLDDMELIKQHSAVEGTTVLALRHTTTGQYYMVKRVDVPISQTQVDALLVTGAVADTDAAQAYYEQIVEDYITEFKLWYQLNGNTNLAAFLDMQTVAKEGEVGFEVYLLSHHWITLSQYLWDNAMTWLKALNLALDLCSGLCQLRSANVVHRNIKPENVYMDNLGNFMLGDLGLVDCDNLRFSTMPDNMISIYSAPEACDILGEPSINMDIYSVGMILYRIFNGNHGPFEDEETSAIAGNKMRLNGVLLPVPLYADYELAEIIAKACTFDPANRYQSPQDMKQDLVHYMQRNHITDQLIIPPLNVDEDIYVAPEDTEEEILPISFTDTKKLDHNFVSSFTPDTHNLADLVKEVRSYDEASAAEEEAVDLEYEEPSGSKKGVWITVACSLVALVAVCVFLYLYFFTSAPSLNVLTLEVTEKTTNSLCIVADTDDPTVSFDVVCTDAYGNVIRIPYVDGGVTLSDLTPGTAYEVTLSSSTTLSGTTSLNVSTTAVTDVISLTAIAPAVGQAQLDFTVSGADPQQWSVTYFAEGEASQISTFTGHSVLIFGLTPGKTYTFTLEPPEGGTLTGETAVTLRVGPEVTISNLTTSQLTESMATLVWDSSAPLPDGEVWSITATTNDGTPMANLTATENTVDLTNLETGLTYTVNVTSPSTTTPATLVISPTVANVMSFTASKGDADGSIDLVWSTDILNGDWRILYTPQFSTLTSSKMVTGDSTTLTDLIPGVTYQIELQTSAGQRVSGDSTVEQMTALAGKFNDYGTASFFMGLFAHPGKENWSKNDLAEGRSEFAPEEALAFGVNSLSGLNSSSDTVKISVVVRDKANVPVYHTAYSDTWNDMWPSDLFIGEVTQVPSEPGTYTLQLYFNNDLVIEKNFDVTA